MMILMRMTMILILMMVMMMTLVQGHVQLQPLWAQEVHTGLPRPI